MTDRKLNVDQNSKLSMITVVNENLERPNFIYEKAPKKVSVLNNFGLGFVFSVFGLGFLFVPHHWSHYLNILLKWFLALLNLMFNFCPLSFTNDRIIS